MDYKLIVIIVVLLVAVVGYVRLYRHYRRNIKKVRFLFDAIDNGDFSFNFPTEKRNKEDKILHQSLNRIKLFLQHTREEQMEREKYYEQILNAVDTGIMVVDSHDNIMQHNQAALRLLDTDVLTHINQVKGKLKDEHLAKHETQAMLKDKHVRIIALSDVSHELSNQEVDSWIKLIRVLTHEIMNTITPVTSLSETLLKELGSQELYAAKSSSAEQAKLKQGLETIHKTGTELLAFVNNYRRFTHVPQPQPALFYVEPFLERMAMLCNHEVEIAVTPKDLLAYADESLISHVVT
ncbi:sensor histidine kinase, partial [Prevotella sp.]